MPTVVSFKQIDGTTRFNVDGHDMSEQEFRENARYYANLRKVDPTPDEEFNSIRRQFETQLENEFEASGKELTDSAANKIVEQADIKAKNFLGFTPKQPATVKSGPSPNSLAARKEALRDRTIGTRMAGDAFNRELSEALVPWKDRKRKDGDDIWMEKNAKQFQETALDITDRIQSAEGNSNQLKNIQDELVNVYGHGAKQAWNEIDSVLNGEVLTTLKIGVPNAAADEGIGNTILRGSGIDSRINNQGDPITATDFMAKIGSGEMKGIDAARQFSPDSLKIGMFNLLPRQVAKEMEMEVDRNPDKKLGVIIDMLNREGFLEDKFMHSLVYNKAPGKKLRDQFDTTRKDYLMSADMRGTRQNKIDQQVFRFRDGPYNPELAKDYRLLDLNMARDELLNTNIGELKGKGYKMQSVGRNFAMFMPNDEVTRFSDNGLLDQGILQEVRRRYITGR